jgi:hypothetical protein
MIESSASGTTFTGKKAFARITRVSFSAAVTGATVGTGTVLGLPILVASSVQIRNDTGTTETPATIVAADLLTKPSATSGDIRGTVEFTNAPNATRQYRLFVSVPGPISVGQPPFNA